VSVRLNLPDPREVGAELVFDSSALYHPAAADRLDVLGDLVAGHDCVAPRAVMEEIDRAATRDPRLRGVARQPWLRQVRIDSLDDLPHLFRWAELLGAGVHHRGEATVLTYAQSHRAIAIVDDQRPRVLARQHGLMAHGTLWLIARACRLGRTSPAAASGLIDALRAAGARYPCEGSTFASWARSNGLLASDPEPADRRAGRRQAVGE
jgi:predicted nucleic acid-binding protein